jgi:hypothetical protein
MSAHMRLAQLVDGAVGDLINEPYEGTKEQRRAIRLMTSTLIGRPSFPRVVTPSQCQHVAVCLDDDCASYQPSVGSSWAITTWPVAMPSQLGGDLRGREPAAYQLDQQPKLEPVRQKDPFGCAVRRVGVQAEHAAIVVAEVASVFWARRRHRVTGTQARIAFYH